MGSRERESEHTDKRQDQKNDHHTVTKSPIQRKTPTIQSEKEQEERERQTSKQTDKQANRQTNIQTAGKQTDADRQDTSKQTDGQTNRVVMRHSNRQRERERRASDSKSHLFTSSLTNTTSKGTNKST